MLILLRRTLPLFLALLALGLTGCAESGGGSTTGSAGTGRVAIALTDAPTDEFVEVLITVVSIDLLPGDDDSERETIFEGVETFDLLALENVAEPFAIAADVPAGTYSKLRLGVSSIELVRMLEDGSFESVFPRLPGGDRIDLNPRGGFEVVPGETLALQLDIDARRSIHIVGNGNGRYHFRPQVFVEIMDEERESRLVSLAGVVEQVEEGEDGVRFELCEVDLEYRDRDGRLDRYCVTVFTGDETCVFDEMGLASSVAEISEDDRLTVLGRFRRDENEDFAVDAAVIELGGLDAYLKLTGLVSGVYDEASETIVVELDPGQGFLEGTELEVDLSEGTRIFTRAGEVVAPGDIELDSVIEVDGILVLNQGAPDLLRASILFVRMLDDDLGEPVDVTAAGSTATMDLGDADLFEITIVRESEDSVSGSYFGLTE